MEQKGTYLISLQDIGTRAIAPVPSSVAETETYCLDTA